MSSAAPRIAIVGGGPAGSLLAILLARRGLTPTVIERSPPFTMGETGGRSINLALAARGLAALRQAGIVADVAQLMIPMRGRMLHEPGQKQRFLSYGQRAAEEIYSVSRAALNTLLYEIAARDHGVAYRFGETCVGVDLADGAPLIESVEGTRRLEVDVVFATDGAGSEVRRALADADEITASEDLLDHGYKELTIAAAQDGEFALEPHALHIWPRGRFMLIALPNPNRTFTATLFLPHTGEPSFASLGANDVLAFFRREFADAVPLLPTLQRDYVAHPTGHLGTVYCRPWSFKDRVLLVGDAAHAVVPFHGQGMNAAFEDCLVLDELIGAHARGPARLACDLRGLRGRARPEHARNRGDGAGELPRDARRGPRRAVRAARELVVRARAAFPRQVRPALLDGDVPPRDFVRGGATARCTPGADPA